MTASESPLSFNVDLSSINIIAANPDHPVLILSPSERIVPAFKLENSSVPTAIISTRPFTFVATGMITVYVTSKVGGI